MCVDRTLEVCALQCIMGYECFIYSKDMCLEVFI
jgi:hypothetical protein